MKTPRSSLALLIAALVLHGTASAESLYEIYQRAQESDPALRAAAAARDAVVEVKPQSRSGVLPNIGLGGDISRDSYDRRDAPPIVSKNSTYATNQVYSLSLVQPLFRWDRWVALGQADELVMQAEASYTAAEQELAVRVAERYFAALEAALTPRTRLLLLCHPHNPVGRVWREEELLRVIDLARRHDLIVCSDEIHCDLVLDADLRHHPLARLDPAFAQRTITLLAPSKTWNVPGLGCSFALIPDPELRRRFRHEMAGLVPSVNLLGFTAAEAAYRDDGAWRRGLIDYLRGNREVLQEWFAHSRRLKLTVPEATYLAWIDARAIDATNPLPAFEAQGVGLSDGRDFGFPGYLRLNFGCRRAILNEALRRLAPERLTFRIEPMLLRLEPDRLAPDRWAPPK